MREVLDTAKALTIQWTQDYGYHAVVPALLVDPAGVPWAWIFLMLLAAEAGKSIPLLLAYGFVVLNVSDYLLYWIGIKGGRPLVHRVESRWPKVGECVRQAENAVRGRGVWVIAIGRYLPLTGRYTGMAAGVAGVPFARFAFFNAVGVALTVFGFGLLAHAIGRSTIDSPLFAPTVAALFIGGTVLSTIFLGWRMYKSRRDRRESPVDAV